MANPNIKIIHYLKAITPWANHIGLCGKGVRSNSTTTDRSAVTCKNCLRTLDNQGN